MSHGCDNMPGAYDKCDMETVLGEGNLAACRGPPRTGGLVSGMLRVSRR
jgi:hypothetical protein